MKSENVYRDSGILWIALSAVLVLAPQVHGQNMVEFSSEARFQLDLQVPDAALKSFLPDGWTSNVAARGPAKDANLRAVFIDRVSINGPDGKPMGKGSNRLVYLVAPVKDPSGTNLSRAVPTSAVPRHRQTIPAARTVKPQPEILQ